MTTGSDLQEGHSHGAHGHSHALTYFKEAFVAGVGLNTAFALGATLAAITASRILVIGACLGGALLFGAAIGATVISGLSTHWVAAVLAFGCAALLYLVTEELLVEAHEAGETAFATAMFFVGFLLFLVIGMTA
jgi:ZIP family zinc transporter